MGRTRLGIVGAGTTVQQVHLPAFASMADVEVVAICSLQDADNHACTRQYGIPESLTDYRRLLAIDELDAIVVAVPNHLHSEIALAALKHGKHVLCERPVGVSSAEAREVARVAAECDQVYLQRLPQRFLSESRLAREFISKGYLGRILYGKAIDIRRDPMPQGWYTNRRQAGGGALLQLGLPLLDLLLWFLDYPAMRDASASTFRLGAPLIPTDPLPPSDTSEPPRVWERVGRFLGSARRPPPEPTVTVHDVEDAALAMLHLDGGVSLMLETSWSHQCRQSTRTLELFGDEGGLELWPLRLYRMMDGIPVDIVPQTASEDENAILARHFIDCITRGTRPQGTAAEGVALMQIVESLYASAERHVPVST